MLGGGVGGWLGEAFHAITATTQNITLGCITLWSPSCPSGLALQRCGEEGGRGGQDGAYDTTSIIVSQCGVVSMETMFIKKNNHLRKGSIVGEK